MEHNIPEIRSARKVQEWILLVIVVLLALTSFGLGRLSVSTTNSSPVALCMHPFMVEKEVQTDPMHLTPQARYVASKNGSAYHFPWCSGAQRIHEENLISFTTKEEAEQAGYRPATNCKGLE